MLGKKSIYIVLALLSQKVAGIAEQQEANWHYDLPNFQQPIASIAISLDGTCMHMSKEGWREARRARSVFKMQKANGNILFI